MKRVNICNKCGESTFTRHTRHTPVNVRGVSNPHPHTCNATVHFAHLCSIDLTASCVCGASAVHCIRHGWRWSEEGGAA